MDDKFGYNNQARDMSSQFSVPPPYCQNNAGFNSGNEQFWNKNNHKGKPSRGNMGNDHDHQVGPANQFNRGSSSGNSRGMSIGDGGKTDFNKGFDTGGAGDMITQEDTIFVSGMNSSTTEQDIQNHFGAIGIIKKDKKTMKPKIWLYKHKDTGVSKGEATVTYDDVNAAQSAISWFDGREFNGCTIHVSLAQRQNNWSKSSNNGGRFSSGNRRGGGAPRAPTNERGGGGGGSGGGGRMSDQSSNSDWGGSRSNQGQSGNNRNVNAIPQREGDWICSECSNTNFAWRNECNRCKNPKRSGGGDDGGNSGGGGGGSYGDRRSMGGNGNRSGGGGGGGGGFSRGGDNNSGNRNFNRNAGRGGGGGYMGGDMGRKDGGGGGSMRSGGNSDRVRPY